MAERAKPDVGGNPEAWLQLQVLGSGLTIIGGVAYTVSFFLKNLFNASLWYIATTENNHILSIREPLILSILAVLAVGLALAATTRDATALCVGQAIIGCYLFGQGFNWGLPSYSHLEIGYWTRAVGGLAMAVGGVLALVGNLRRRASLSEQPS
jgi:hypothetical protein